MNQNTLETKTIIKLFIISFVVGTFLVIAAVMPAEFGIDPLGTGKLLGLNKLYEVQSGETVESVEVKAEPKEVLQRRVITLAGDIESEYILKQEIPAEVNDPAPKEQYSERNDELEITVPAGRGLEYKVKIKKHGQIKYEWNSEDVTLFHDFHGDPLTTKGWYQSYTIAYSNNMAGTLLAPFHGKHGWYFKNHTSKDVTVKLRVKGQYELIN